MLAFRPLLYSGSGSAPSDTCLHSDRYCIVAVGQPQVPHVGIQTVTVSWQGVSPRCHMSAFRPLLDSGSGSAPGATCWHSDRYCIVAVGQHQVPHVGIQTVTVSWQGVSPRCPMSAFRPLLDSGDGSAPGATCLHSDRYCIVAVGQPQVPHVGIQTVTVSWQGVSPRCHMSAFRPLLDNGGGSAPGATCLHSDSYWIVAVGQPQVPHVCIQTVTV